MLTLAPPSDSLSDPVSLRRQRRQRLATDARLFGRRARVDTRYDGHTKCPLDSVERTRMSKQTTTLDRPQSASKQPKTCDPASESIIKRRNANTIKRPQDRADCNLLSVLAVSESRRANTVERQTSRAGPTRGPTRSDCKRGHKRLRVAECEPRGIRQQLGSHSIRFDSIRLALFAHRSRVQARLSKVLEFRPNTATLRAAL